MSSRSPTPYEDIPSRLFFVHTRQVPEGAIREEDDGQLADGQDARILALKGAFVPLREAAWASGRGVQDVPPSAPHASRYPLPLAALHATPTPGHHRQARCGRDPEGSELTDVQLPDGMYVAGLTDRHVANAHPWRTRHTTGPPRGH